jgi:hypothetical protein
MLSFTSTFRCGGVHATFLVGSVIRIPKPFDNFAIF